MRKTNLIVALMLVTAIGGGCEGNDSQYSPVMTLLDDSQVDWGGNAKLKCSRNCGEAETYFKEMAKSNMLMQLEQQRRYYIKYRSANSKNSVDGGPMAATEMDAGAESPGASQDSAEEYSDTNVQVEGVDEADFVKTDGNLLYTISGNDLVIVDAWPPEQMHETGRMHMVGTPYAFYRYDSKLVVLSRSNRSALLSEADAESHADEPYYYNWRPVTLLTIIDAEDPYAPKLVEHQAYDGYMMSTRRIGAHVYLVQQNYLYEVNAGLSYWPDVEYGSSVAKINNAFEKLADDNLAHLNSLDLSDFMPLRYELNTDGTLNTGSATVMTSCEAIYQPTTFSGYGHVTVVTVDLDDKSAPYGASVLGNWGTVYASLGALYVASTNWSYWWWWEDSDDKPMVTSHLHKFVLNKDTGRADYTASGTVPGYALNQFSLDEFDGHLRIATTDPDWWWWGNEENLSESYVTVLEESNGLLQPVGQVSGLGMGERIYSVRFIKDKGYVVTFRQVDPLYVLDLSEPDYPRVTGELKIPGFSSYMHPISDEHLLTVGRDATEEGQILGLAFQIFDVSDPADPKQIAKTTLGESDGWNSWMWSDALWDHHAFVYFGSRKLLAIPVAGWTYDDSEGGSWYGKFHSELQLFKVGIEEGVKPIGAVSHLDLLGKAPSDDDCYYYYYNWYNWRTRIRRGVFMDDYLYSVSDLGLKVHESEAVSEGAVSNLQILDAEAEDNNYYNSYGYCWAD